MFICGLDAIAARRHRLCLLVSYMQLALRGAALYSRL